MKQILTVIFSIGCIPLLFGQNIASVNSGAVSNNTLIYTVGEIFVTPANPNESASGVIGALSRIEFLSLGIEELLFSKKITFYPNPTSNSVYLETNEVIKKLWIYDNNGKLISVKNISNNKVELGNLQTGIYFIKPNNSSKKSFKIIKK